MRTTNQRNGKLPIGHAEEEDANSFTYHAVLVYRCRVEAK